MTALLEKLCGPNGYKAQLGWEPHPIQSAALSDARRNVVLAAGRRAGKSQVGGHKLVPYAFTALAEADRLTRTGKRREYWIVGPEYSDGEKEFRVLYNALNALGVPFDKPGTYNNPWSGEMHISLWNGLYQVHVRSAKYPDSLVGEGLSGVVLSEAAKLKQSIWQKYLRPTLADFDGWSFMGSTPEGRNWFYRAWQAGQDPDQVDWGSHQAPAWCNPHVYKRMQVDGKEAMLAVATIQRVLAKRIIPERLPVVAGLRRFVSDEVWEGAQDRAWHKLAEAFGVDGEVMSLLLDLSEEVFNQEIKADFNEFVGRVFKDFDETYHVADLAYDPNWKTYAALDYGFTNPFVWLLIQVDPFGNNIRILDEYYERGRTTREAAAEIRARGLAPDSILEFYPDPAEPDRSFELSEILGIRSAGGTGGLIQDRLEWIRRKLKPHPVIAHLDPSHPEWVPQIQINRRCKETIREWNTYRYPKTAEEAEAKNQEAPENPLKKDDHTAEAFGRFMIGHFGSPWREEAPARQRTARVARTRRRPRQ